MNKKDMYKKFSEILGGTSVLLIISCFVVLILEVYLWLRHGTWTSHPIIGFIPNIEEWLFYQNDWVGLKKMILWLFQCPLSLFLFIVGILMLFINIKFDKHNS